MNPDSELQLDVQPSSPSVEVEDDDTYPEIPFCHSFSSRIEVEDDDTNPEAAEGSIALSRYYLNVFIRSFTLFIVFLLLFVLWMFLSKRHPQSILNSFHNLKHDADHINKYGTKTFATTLLWAFLQGIISIVLHRWKVKSIYNRFRGRILMAAFRLFFLNLILEGTEHLSLLPWMYQRQRILIGFRWVEIKPPPNQERKNTIKPKRLSEILAGNTKSSVAFRATFKRNSIRDRMKLSPHVSFAQIKELTEALMNLANKTSSEDEDNQISDLLRRYQWQTTISGAGTWNKKYLTEEEIRELVGVWNADHAKILVEELKAEYPSKQIYQVPFENWLVEAHKSCVAVGYSLVDAFAMLKALKRILFWCLLIFVTIIWLLVMELATTTTLVVIASQFVAFAFVLGETFKAFFQGFIFAFISHPINIGDRCSIDGVQVEVKRMSIMTTTTLKVGTKERMVFPNSVLASKVIINLEGKLDSSDVIELVLDRSTSVYKIKQLQGKIEEFLEHPDQREQFEKSCRVVVKEATNGIKFITYFQHTVDGQDVSQSQFLEKKEMQRSILFIHIKNQLELLNIQVTASN